MRNANSIKYDENDSSKRRVIDEGASLLISIQKVKESLNSAYANFDLVTEPALVDSYIYELKSIQLKYQYLIQQAKELGIIASIF